MRKLLYAITIASLLGVGLLGQASFGGAFLPAADYTLTGAWTHSGTTTFSGVSTFTGVATMTSPVINASTGTKPEAIVTATKAVTAAESGTTFYLNSATEFVTTLPAPAIGLRYTFIVDAAPSGASYTVVTASSSNIIKGLQNSVAGDAGDSGTADDTITLVDGQAVAGDKVEVYTDGTSWFAYGISKVAAGMTFTQAS